MSGAEMGVVKKIWETVADRGLRGADVTRTRNQGG